MGAGKTSAGQRLAKRLGRPFADVDAEITRQHGPISRIFAEQGEAKFRRLEAGVARELLARPPSVIALGGGTVLDPGIRSRMAREFVVFLDVSKDAVVRRLAGQERPLLRHDIVNLGLADWLLIYEHRRETYDALSDRRIDTSQRGVDEVVDAIIAELPETVDNAPLPERAVVGAPASMPLTTHRLAHHWARHDRDARQMELVSLLQRAAALTAGSSTRMLESHGLNKGQLDVLVALHRHGEDAMTQAALAEQMQVTPAAIQKRLAGLMSDGLVTRAASDEDARKYLLALTRKGRGLVERIMEGFLDAEGSVLARLDSADQRQLTTLLRVLLGLPTQGDVVG